MKKLLVILAAFSFSAATVSAQTLPTKAAHGQHRMKGDKAAKTPEQRADHAARSLAKKLNLSATQTEQVRQLHLRRAQEMQAYKAQAATTPATKRQHHEAMKAGKAQYEAQLKQILSAEQYAKYAQLRADKMSKHKANRQGIKQDKS
jgi:Spy/CpxP family protein refolding chaperone